MDSSDPLGVKVGTRKCESLPTWTESLPKSPPSDKLAGRAEGTTSENETAAASGETNGLPRSPFPYDPSLNDVVALWDGDITKIQCDAIVNTTNESLNDFNKQSVAIMEAGGPLLATACQASGSCRTGEVRVTEGYNLPTRFVFHTVGPRFNVKYRTAAESALFNCYRSVLQNVAERGLVTLALATVHVKRRGYPSEVGAHIAIRVVRRWLEKNKRPGQRVVFVLDTADLELYKQIMPLYFPRSRAEEQAALAELPQDIGNEDGEPVIAERQIRVGDVMSELRAAAEAGVDADGSLALEREEFDASCLATMAGDHDEARLQQLAKRSTNKEEEARNRYKQWLQRAKMEDVSSIAALRCIYLAGLDKQGRRIVVWVGKKFPAKQINLNKALCHVINTLDRVVNKEFVIVYFHTGSTNANQPSTSFLREAYRNLDNRYRKNMRSLYIVHSTFWVKMMVWFFATFTLSDIKRKIHHLAGVEYLYDHMAPDQLDVPAFVAEADFKMRGENYHVAPKDSEDAKL